VWRNSEGALAGLREFALERRRLDLGLLVEAPPAVRRPLPGPEPRRRAVDRRPALLYLALDLAELRARVLVRGRQPEERAVIGETVEVALDNRNRVVEFAQDAARHHEVVLALGFERPAVSR